MNVQLMAHFYFKVCIHHIFKRRAAVLQLLFSQSSQVPYLKSPASQLEKLKTISCSGIRSIGSAPGKYQDRCACIFLQHTMRRKLGLIHLRVNSISPHPPFVLTQLPLANSQSSVQYVCKWRPLAISKICRENEVCTPGASDLMIAAKKIASGLTASSMTSCSACSC